MNSSTISEPPRLSALEDKLISMITERLETGGKIPPEKQLAKEFGVSRTALREAFSHFEASGIVVSRQGSGRYVQMPNVSSQIVATWGILLRARPEMLMDFLEIRSILEINSLGKAIERADAAQLQHMGTQVLKMKRNAEQGKAFVHEDREFHQTLFKSTGNMMLEQLLTAFWDLFEASEHNKHHDDLVKVANQHEKMLEAFARKDLPLLEELMKDQFADARYRITISFIK